MIAAMVAAQANAGEIFHPKAFLFLKHFDLISYSPIAA
jgi:hypothetical protein